MLTLPQQVTPPSIKRDLLVIFPQYISAKLFYIFIKIKVQSHLHWCNYGIYEASWDSTCSFHNNV